MVELVVVMVVIGIMAAIGIAKMSDRGSFESRAYADQVRSVVRFAQRTALSQRRPVFLVSGPARVAACYDSGCSAGNLVTAPGGSNSRSAATALACRLESAEQPQWLCEGVPTGINFSGFTNSSFAFGTDGVPFSLDNSGNRVALSGEQAATVTGGGVVHQIRFHPLTGYVY